MSQELNKNIAIFLSPKEGIPVMKYPNLGWYKVKTYDEFVDTITKYLNTFEQYPPIIVLNNCLDDEQIVWFQANLGQIPDFNKFKNKTGFHCASFLMELSDAMEFYPPQIIIDGPSHANNIISQVMDKWIEEREKKKEINLYKVQYELSNIILN